MPTRRELLATLAAAWIGGCRDRREEQGAPAGAARPAAKPEEKRTTMDKLRRVTHTSQSMTTMEGAGVRLRRAFGFQQSPSLDPFLLLDDFRSADPEHYRAGFPWHPHRGIETITYVLAGDVEHGDSLGNAGTIGAGDVQWMTAGSGIVHQEMPQGDADGRMEGFQLWANLPAKDKMMDPRYRDVKAASIPEVELGPGVKAKVVAGEVGGVRGPVGDIVIEPEYLDLSLEPGREHRHPTTPGHTVFAYAYAGDGEVGPSGDGGAAVRNGTLAIFGDGEEARIATATEPLRLLLISGKPLREPVAWRGPIVMNTEQELRLAFEEYRNGTFIKSR